VSTSNQTYLLVPATRPDRVAKAVGLDVDVVIVDLEDAVGETQKSGARESLLGLEIPRRVYVRINSLRTKHWRADLDVCNALDMVEGVVLPKVESAEEYGRVRDAMARPLAVSALVETPRGIQVIDEIAESGFERLLFGGIDYSSALGVMPSNELFAYPRSRLVIASASSGLPAPVDGPTTGLKNRAQLREDLMAAGMLGMGGKLCIHPSQLADVREVFSPSDALREWARAVIAESDHHAGAVFSLRGEMIDLPVVERARRLLEF
jgi:citrate lyase subunit beta / citryl-CoA lyase